LIKSPSLS